MLPAMSARLLRCRLLCGLLLALALPRGSAAAPAPAAADGPVILLFSPASAPRGAEEAYTAARPFLGAQRPVGVQSLDSVIRVDEYALVVTGETTLTCAERAPEGTLRDKLVEAMDAAYGLEPDVAAAAARAAPAHLACGGEPPRLADAASLVRARAVGQWFAGDRAAAAALWHELFMLVPDAPTDPDLPPDALAAQLDARARATSAPARAQLAFVLAPGWSATIDGTPADLRTVTVAAGQRVVRLRGPSGRTVGAIVLVPAAAALAVGTGGGLAAELGRPQPAAPLLAWLGAQFDAAARAAGASATLLVDLAPSSPTVRRFEAGSSLLLTTSGTTRGGRPPSTAARGGHVGSAVLLGAGVAAVVGGLIAAGLAHRDGLALQDTLGTVAGFDSSYSAYEAARTRERIGAGLAVGGGVVAAFGSITFAIPTRTARP